MNIIAKLEDLLKQATVDRSHFYVGSCCREAIAELKRRDEEIASLRKDAERYRWLRNEISVGVPNGMEHEAGALVEVHDNSTDVPEELDKLIDAAMNVPMGTGESNVTR